MPVTRPAASAMAVLGLFAVTAAWGSSFILVKDVIGRVPVADFLALRFLLAFLALWALFPRSVLRLSRREWRHGVILGGIYGVAQIVQTAGLLTIDASVSGFVTGMYVVFTPLIAAALLRLRLGWAVWASVAMATVGVAALTLQGARPGALVAGGWGELLTLAGAVLYAAHIVALGVWSRSGNAVGLSVVQLGVIAAVCAIGALPGGLVLPQTAGDWWAVIYMAVAAGAFALVVQTWAQAHLPATRAAIIMTLEPVWAAGFAVGLGSERLSGSLILGGALILGAMYLAELGPRRPGEPDVAQEVGGVAHVGPV